MHLKVQVVVANKLLFKHSVEVQPAPTYPVYYTNYRTNFIIPDVDHVPTAQNRLFYIPEPDPKTKKKEKQDKTKTCPNHNHPAISVGPSIYGECKPRYNKCMEGKLYSTVGLGEVKKNHNKHHKMQH
jgi:hypothetical protein